MTRRPFHPWLALALAVALLPAAAGAAEHRFGVGVHYWRAVDDLADEGFDIDEDGLAPYLTYQLVPAGIFRFEVDLEYFEKGFGGATSAAFAPVVYLLVGGGIYGGVGIGVTLSDDFEDNVSDPFYAARVGLSLQLLPRVHLDVNANYRADAFAELEEADTDAITLGAAVRVGL
ncbi:MAG TPA: hypothetical protein VMT16_16310 [Thermoanaerobaculia bacterium]|nr:hypothetical protein [Thermoanaerobaculia bacterium]